MTAPSIRDPSAALWLGLRFCHWLCLCGLCLGLGSGCAEPPPDPASVVDSGASPHLDPGWRRAHPTLAFELALLDHVRGKPRPELLEELRLTPLDEAARRRVQPLIAVAHQIDPPTPIAALEALDDHATYHVETVLKATAVGGLTLTDAREHLQRRRGCRFARRELAVALHERGATRAELRRLLADAPIGGPDEGPVDLLLWMELGLLEPDDRVRASLAAMSQPIHPVDIRVRAAARLNVAAAVTLGAHTDDPLARLALAEALVAEGRTRAARATLVGVPRSRFGRRMATVEATAAIEEGRYADARALLSDRRDARSSALAARAALALGQWDAVRRIVDRADGSEPMLEVFGLAAEALEARAARAFIPTVRLNRRLESVDGAASWQPAIRAMLHAISGHAAAARIAHAALEPDKRRYVCDVLRANLGDCPADDGKVL